MEKIKTLICIIGAGPSGATCSIFLSKMGIAHVIVDAAVFPRDKICGDGIDLLPSAAGEHAQLLAQRAFDPERRDELLVHRSTAPQVAQQVDELRARHVLRKASELCWR